jgi:hypothetical protein
MSMWFKIRSIHRRQQGAHQIDNILTAENPIGRSSQNALCLRAIEQEAFG